MLIFYVKLRRECELKPESRNGYEDEIENYVI